jgi:hypothetical protein
MSFYEYYRTALTGLHCIAVTVEYQKTFQNGSSYQLAITINMIQMSNHGLKGTAGRIGQTSHGCLIEVFRTYSEQSVVPACAFQLGVARNGTEKSI